MPKNKNEKQKLIQKTKVSENKHGFLHNKKSNKEQLVSEHYQEAKIFNPKKFSEYTLVAALNGNVCKEYYGSDAWIMKANAEGSKEVFAILNTMPWVGVEVSDCIRQSDYLPYSINAAGNIMLKFESAVAAANAAPPQKKLQDECVLQHKQNVEVFNSQHPEPEPVKSRCGGCNII